MRAQRPQAYAHSCTFMFMFIVTLPTSKVDGTPAYHSPENVKLQMPGVGN